MKRIVSILFLGLVFCHFHALAQYDTTGFFGQYKYDWSLVKLDNKYGFINDKGKEVVSAIYDSIGYFEVYRYNWALVKHYNKYGLINDKGKEVVPAI